MSKVKQTLKKIQNHVEANKVAYAGSVIAITAVALQQCNRIAFNKFLISKGIDPEEYYCPESYEEKKNAN